MKLRFPQSEIRHLAFRYEEDLKDRDMKLTELITKSVFPSYALKGYLNKDEFLSVCAWKTQRSKPRCESNDEDLVRDVSALARTTESERLRIQVWTLLSGVQWPTASVFLHFSFSDRYPILDFRALWSLETEVPAQYTFSFWVTYTDVCQKLAHKAGVTMRILDQALWKYSELHQRT